MTISAPFGGPWDYLGTIFGDQVGHRCTQGDPGGCQNGFLMIFDGFWVPHWRPFWVTFWYFLWFGVSKSMFGLQAWFLMIFDWKISWFVMPQPLKNIVNTIVFIGFHVFCRFSDFDDFRYLFGPHFWDIWRSWEPFWRFLIILRRHRNSIEFYDLAG